MKRSLRYLFLVVIFSLGFRTPATACSPIGWDFAKYFSVSKAVVHGHVLNISHDGAKAALQVLAYSGPGAAPATIDLPQSEIVRGGGNCPDLQLKFKMGGEYVVFLGDVPPSLRFADEVRSAVLVDENGYVKDMFSHTNSVEGLLHDFASDRGYSVQRPEAGAPQWTATARAPKWAVVAAGVLLLFGLLAVRRRLTA